VIFGSCLPELNGLSWLRLGALGGPGDVWWSLQRAFCCRWEAFCSRLSVGRNSGCIEEGRERGSPTCPSLTQLSVALTLPQMMREHSRNSS
jgi:hypothetical protein